MNAEDVKPAAPVIASVSRCDYYDPADGKRCTKGGKKLRLMSDTGPVTRCLCRDHSDWIERQEA